MDRLIAYCGLNCGKCEARRATLLPAREATMHDVWKSQKADSHLQTEIWDIPHSCGIKAQQRILEFFDKELK